MMLPSDFERGHAAGYNEAEMDEFRRHFKSLNGSVETTGAALAALERVVSAQGDRAEQRESETLAVAKALAAETERVRAALADKTAHVERRFTRGDKIAGALIALVALGLTAYGNGVFG